MPALSFDTTQTFPTKFGPRLAEVIPAKRVVELIQEHPEDHPLRTFRLDRFVTGKFGRVIIPNELDLSTPTVATFLEALRQEFWVLMTVDMDQKLGQRDRGEFKTRLSFICAFIDNEWEAERAAAKAEEEAQSVLRTELIEKAIAEETETLIAAVSFDRHSHMIAGMNQRVKYLDLSDEDAEPTPYFICGVQKTDDYMKIELLVADEQGVPTGEVIEAPVNQMLHVVPSELPFSLRYYMKLEQHFWRTDDDVKHNRWVLDGQVYVRVELDSRSSTEITIYCDNRWNSGVVNCNINWSALGSESVSNCMKYADALKYAAKLAAKLEIVANEEDDDADSE